MQRVSWKSRMSNLIPRLAQKSNLKEAKTSMSKLLLLLAFLKNVDWTRATTRTT